MKEEFKAFVRKRPYLTNYVNNGKMTWQKFYEQWRLYGEDEAIWKKYETNQEKKEETQFNFNTIAEMLKKVDMDSVQKGVNSLQKIVTLIQGIITPSSSQTDIASYEPRELFKKFED